MRDIIDPGDDVTQAASRFYLHPEERPHTFVPTDRDEGCAACPFSKDNVNVHPDQWSEPFFANNARIGIVTEQVRDGASNTPLGQAVKER